MLRQGAYILLRPVLGKEDHPPILFSRPRIRPVRLRRREEQQHVARLHLYVFN